MFHSAKKLQKMPPPYLLFLLPLPPENANYHVLRLIIIITYLYKQK